MHHDSVSAQELGFTGHHFLGLCAPLLVPWCGFLCLVFSRMRQSCGEVVLPGSDVPSDVSCDDDDLTLSISSASSGRFGC